MPITTHHAKRIFETGSYGARLGVVHNIILNLDEWLPWLSAKQFTGMTYTLKEDGWLIVLRATAKGRPQVAFFAGVDPEDATVVMVHSLLYGLESWKPDKWGSIRSDKS